MSTDTDKEPNTDDIRPEPEFDDLHPEDDEDDGLPPNPPRRARNRRDDDDDADDGIDIDDPLGLDDDDDLDEDEEDDEEDDDDERPDPLADPLDDDGDEPYSKRVRKRIARERRLKSNALARSQQLEHENAELRRRLETRDDRNDDQVKDLENKVGDLKTRLEKAIEDGNTKQQLDLEDQLYDARADLREAKSQTERASPQRQDGGDGQRQPERANPHRDRFLYKHSRWWGDRSRKAVKLQRRVMMIDAEVAEDGYDPNTREYWDEVERRMAREYPKQFGNTKTRQKRRRGNRPSTPSVAQSRVPRGGRGGGKQVRITAEDRENMQRFGLDPANAQHVKEYAANKTDK